MKFTKLTTLLLLCGMASFAISCGDYAPMEYEQVTKMEYSKNFEAKYGKIKKDQTWDFSTDALAKKGLVWEGRPYSKINYSPVPNSRAVVGACVDGKGVIFTTAVEKDNADKTKWYNVDQNLYDWLDEHLPEQVYNRSAGEDFKLVMPETDPNDFYIIPIYQGEAGMQWRLHIVYIGNDDKKYDYIIWDKSDYLEYYFDPEIYSDNVKYDYFKQCFKKYYNSNEQKEVDLEEGWHSLWNDYKSINKNSAQEWYNNTLRTHNESPAGQDSIVITTGKTAVRGLPMKIDATKIKPRSEFYLYLEITRTENDENGNARALFGAQQRSDSFMMRACLTGTNLPSGVVTANEINGFLGENPFEGKTPQYMVIGCEDANLTSDWDYNDVVFMLIGSPSLPQTVEIKKKRYLVEDLGSTFDWDFNDIVVDVNESRTYTYTVNSDGHTEKQQVGEAVQCATVVSTYNTLPFQVKVGNTLLPAMRGKLGDDPFNLKKGKVRNISRTIEGWKPDENNITVYIGYERDNNSIPDDNQLRDDAEFSGNSQDLEKISATVEFSPAGQIPYILAVDQDIDPNDEGDDIRPEWLETTANKANAGNMGGNNAGDEAGLGETTEGITIAKLPNSAMPLQNDVKVDHLYNDFTYDFYNLRNVHDGYLYVKVPAGMKLTFKLKYRGADGSDQTTGPYTLDNTESRAYARIFKMPVSDDILQAGERANGYIQMNEIALTSTPETSIVRDEDYATIKAWIDVQSDIVGSGEGGSGQGGSSGQTGAFTECASVPSGAVSLLPLDDIGGGCYQKNLHETAFGGRQNSDTGAKLYFTVPANKTIKFQLQGGGSVTQTVYQLANTSDATKRYELDIYSDFWEKYADWLQIQTIDGQNPATSEIGISFIVTRETVTITTQVNNSDMGSVTDVGTVAKGSTVTLNATANTGYKFVQWTDGEGNPLSTDNPYYHTANETKTIKAVFANAAQCTISVTTDGHGTATVNDAVGSATVYEGESVTLEAVPNDGYRFKEWTKNSTSVSTSSTYTVKVSETCTYHAVFEEGRAVSLLDIEGEEKWNVNYYSNTKTIDFTGKYGGYGWKKSQLGNIDLSDFRKLTVEYEGTIGIKLRYETNSYGVRETPYDYDGGSVSISLENNSDIKRFYIQNIENTGSITLKSVTLE